MKITSLLICASLFILTSCQHEYVRPENYQNPVAEIITERGTITVELFEDQVPNTVSNFIILAESGFYNNMLFHYIVPGAFIQGGCPNTKPGAEGKPGLGGPGYSIKEEFKEHLNHNSAGILSMAKGYGKNSSGSQFMILFDKVPVFNGRQTVFGKVIKGMETLKTLEKFGSKTGQPKNEEAFSIKIIRKNDIEYHVNKED